MIEKTTMFERASMLKLRVNSPVGLLTVEDLWDLPLSPRISYRACLDDIAKALNSELQSSSQESFVEKDIEPDERLELSFEIVKHIIGVKLDMQRAAETAEKLRQKKQQILEIVAKKETEDLAGKSLDELKALLAEM